MRETKAEYIARMMIQYKRIEEQNNHLASALLKLDMMQLTPENGMSEIPPPEGVNPARGKAMVTQAYNQGIPE